MSVYEVLKVAEGLTCRPQKIYISEAKKGIYTHSVRVMLPGSRYLNPYGRPF